MMIMAQENHMKLGNWVMYVIGNECQIEDDPAQETWSHLIEDFDVKHLTGNAKREPFGEDDSWVEFATNKEIV